MVVEEVVAGSDHARTWLAYISWIHADHALNSCTTRHDNSENILNVKIEILSLYKVNKTETQTKCIFLEQRACVMPL